MTKMVSYPQLLYYSCLSPRGNIHEGRKAWTSGWALDLQSGGPGSNPTSCHPSAGMKSEGPGFKSPSLPLVGFVFSSPELNTSTLCK